MPPDHNQRGANLLIISLMIGGNAHAAFAVCVDTQLMTNKTNDNRVNTGRGRRTHPITAAAELRVKAKTNFASECTILSPLP